MDERVLVVQHDKNQSMNQNCNTKQVKSMNQEKNGS